MANSDPPNPEHRTRWMDDDPVAPTIDPSDPAMGERRPPLDPGREFGPYRITRQLGRGGMGEVYEAIESQTGRTVALKILTRALDSASSVSRFLREGRLAAAVSHPNSVYVYGSFQVEGIPAIAMELVRGGTLQDLVDRKGRLAPAEAVDAALQVVAGLEAAHAVGVLHRDVKPSNCFVDERGAVKVGDFGLSMTTGPVDVTRLTMLGTFLGTPAYASPEQVQGTTIDVRSDIYSAGATLYFLLTGRAPFTQAAPMHVFAAVLQQPPDSPRIHAPDVPDALAAVVLRCLKKDPAARYPTYAELRDALLPFGSAVSSPARRSQRCLAMIVDGLMITPLQWIAVSLMGTNPFAAQQIPVLSVVVNLGLDLSYFALLEGLWGASVGKRFCRIRVRGPDGGVPGVGRALVRAAAFFGVLNVGDLVVALQRLNPVITLPASALGLLVVFSTARRRNGYAGIHEWASDTRVVRRPSIEGMPVVQKPRGADDRLPPAGTVGRIGDYIVLERLGATGDGELIAALDPALRRRVWIHTCPPDAAPVSGTRQNVARVARLRWLASRRSDDGWDAYEAIDGGPLSCGQPWSLVRRWLPALAAELESAVGEREHLGPRAPDPGARTPDADPLVVSVDRIWVSDAGAMKLLDFAAPGSDSPREGRTVADVNDAQAFLHEVAVAALEPARGSGVVGTVALPAGARHLLSQLEQRRFETFGALKASLDELVDSAATVSRVKRVAGLAIGSFLPMLMLAGGLAVGAAERAVRADPQLARLNALLTRLERLPSATPDEAGTRHAALVYVGDRFASKIDDPATWSSIRLARHRATADASRSAAKAASGEARAQAEARATGFLADADRWAARRPPILMMLSAIMVITLALVGAAGTIAAAVCRGGLLLLMLGFTIARADGRPITRRRALVRALIAWAPMFAAAGAIALFERFGIRTPAAYYAAASTAMLLGAVTLASIIAHPDRGLHDRIAGTRVVPA